MNHFAKVDALLHLLRTLHGIHATSTLSSSTLRFRNDWRKHCRNA